MTIFSVAVNMHSDTRTIQDLTDLAGVEPTASHSTGDRISPRMPADKVRESTYWSKGSGVEEDTWTLAPHWPTIAPVLESLASSDLSDVQVQLSIGTSARDSGFSFDMAPEQLSLLARVGCWLWIDTYEMNGDQDDLPDDYPFPEGGTLHPAGPLAKD